MLAFGVQNYLEFKLFQGRCSAELASARHCLCLMCLFHMACNLDTETNQRKISIDASTLAEGAVCI